MKNYQIEPKNPGNLTKS